jgi:hypothetical protein
MTLYRLSMAAVADEQVGEESVVRVQRKQQADSKLQVLVRAEGPTRVLSITDLRVNYPYFPALGPSSTSPVALRQTTRLEIHAQLAWHRKVPSVHSFSDVVSQLLPYILRMHDQMAYALLSLTTAHTDSSASSNSMFTVKASTKSWLLCSCTSPCKRPRRRVAAPASRRPGRLGVASST